MLKRKKIAIIPTANFARALILLPKITSEPFAPLFGNLKDAEKCLSNFLECSLSHCMISHFRKVNPDPLLICLIGCCLLGKS